MLTQFQKQHIRAVAQSANFSHFCLGLGKTTDEFIQWLEQDSKSGPLVLAFCAPDFRAHRVGSRRVLQVVD